MDDTHDDDPEVRYVELRHHEYAGPFWEREGHLSDDYADLQRWLGISRELYDDAMAWNSEGGDWTEKQQLLRRLRAELPDRIEVPTPRQHPPRVVRLYRLRVSDVDGERRLLDDDLAEEGRLLPRTPHKLVDDVEGWLEQRARFAYGDDSQVGAHFTWEDHGSELCRRLGEVWGAEYVVKMLP